MKSRETQARLINTLIQMLVSEEDKNARVIILQNYISLCGPIPNEYGEQVRQALMSENSQ